MLPSAPLNAIRRAGPAPGAAVVGVAPTAPAPATGLAGTVCGLIALGDATRLGGAAARWGAICVLGPVDGVGSPGCGFTVRTEREGDEPAGTSAWPTGTATAPTA